MKSKRWLSFWATVCACVLASPVAAQVLIVPLGDSITQAFAGYNSYRRPLWQLLTGGGYAVDFIGRHTDNTGSAPLNPDFDLDHEGHSGFRADELAANLPLWLGSYTADICLLHAGHNDLFHGQSVADTLGDLGVIIDALRTDNPNVTILIAQVIPTSDTTVNPQLSALNAQIPGLAAAKTTANSPVIVVDQNTGFDANTDTYDGVHPNAAGELKMAQRWFAALQAILPLSSLVFITTGANPPEAGITSGGGAVAPEQNVIVRVTPAVGFAFTNWTENGVVVSTAPNYSFTATSNRTLVANLTPSLLPALNFWKFDDGAGTLAVDSSGNADHGRLTNGPLFAALGRLGGALSFDGVNDHVVVPDIDRLDFDSRNFTVALWVKTTKAGPQALVEKHHHSFTGLFLWALNRDNAVPGGFSVWQGGGWIDSNFRGVTDGQFHHLAVTFDGSTFRLYRDGQLDKAQAASASYVNTPLPLTFGRFATANVGWFFQGLLDEILKCNRALSAAEIAALAEMEQLAVPPATRTLTVASVNPNSNVAIVISPPATNGLANGTTLFTRVYTNNSVVMLTAPSSQGANTFLKWQRDGADFTANLTATVTLDADHTLTAVYGGGNDAVGWWPLDEGSGTTALDASGNSNHGKLTNGPMYYVAGCVGGAISFDGVNDSIVVPSASLLEFAGRSFTVALWVKTSKSGPQALVEKQYVGFSGLFLLALNRDNAVPGGFSVWTGDTWLDSNFRGVNNGQWHHLVVAFDGVTFRLYRDGLLDSTQSANVNYQNTGLPLNFGRFATANVGWFFQGLLDDIRRYNRALASEEIAALAQAAPPIRTLDVSSANPNSGVDITVSPADTNGLGNGATAFTHYYSNNAVVMLTAPANASGNPFVKWQRDGVDLTMNLTATVTMDADHSLLAVYQAPAPSARTLTVASVNPNNGVNITVSPNDTNGLGNGATAFTRYYSNNTVVMLTAPASASGNAFVKWQRDGADLTANLTASVTMDADHTLTALYAGGTDTVGWWKFDDGSGTSALDSSGNGNNGRLTNGPIYTNMARIDGGLSFDGINDHVVVSDADVLDFNNRAFTVTLWVKTAKSAPQALVEKQHQFSTGLFLFALNRDNVVPGGFSVWNGGGWIDSNFRGVTDGQFHHLAVTYDGTSFSLYRDGQLDSTQASSANYANTPLPLNFGRFATANIGWLYQGVMDDLRRYNRALSSGEISALVGPLPAPVPVLASSGLAPRLIAIQVQSDRSVLLQGSGVPNGAYRLEASPNLIEWSQISAGEADDDGAFESSDPAAAEFPSRFYRVRTP